MLFNTGNQFFRFIIYFTGIRDYIRNQNAHPSPKQTTTPRLTLPTGGRKAKPKKPAAADAAASHTQQWDWLRLRESLLKAVAGLLDSNFSPLFLGETKLQLQRPVELCVVLVRPWGG